MRILSLTFVLVTLTGVACATEPGTSAQGASLTTETCHVVSTNGKLGKFCGSDQKWTELKSTVGLPLPEREHRARALRIRRRMEAAGEAREGAPAQCGYGSSRGARQRQRSNRVFHAGPSGSDRHIHAASAGASELAIY